MIEKMYFYIYFSNNNYKNSTFQTKYCIKGIFKVYFIQYCYIYIQYLFYLFIVIFFKKKKKKKIDRVFSFFFSVFVFF